MTDLPPLPSPIIRDDTEHGVGYFTADQMRAYAAAARAQALDDAAKACTGEMLHDPQDTEGDIAYMHAVCDCISAIRAMQAPKP